MAEGKDASVSVDQPLHGPTYDFRALGFTPGEVLVVTGGGSGIGQAIAMTAARSGLKVAVWDMNVQGAEATVAAIAAAGGEALAIACDVTGDADVAAAWTATDRLGACRYLVNNAAPGSMVPGFHDNLMAAVGSVHRIAGGWIERAGDAPVAAVNIVSVAGTFQGGKTEAHYPTAKGAITSLTKHFAVKYGGRPRFNAVAPGFTITPRTAPYLDRADVRERVGRIPMARMGWPEEVASAVLFLLSPAASYVNGALLPVDGGWVLS
jgi:NAD(P)-dependent dehydrogenase (short-subunit alcohol dehydrogenase family)